MKLLIKLNFIATIMFIVSMVMALAFSELYMEAPLYSGAEAFYLTVSNISTVIMLISILSMTVMNTIIFIKKEKVYMYRKEIR